MINIEKNDYLVVNLPDMQLSKIAKERFIEEIAESFDTLIKEKQVQLIFVPYGVEVNTVIRGFINEQD